MNAVADYSFSIDTSAGGLVDRGAMHKHGTHDHAAGLSFDALENRGRRKQTASTVNREDVALRGTNRIRLQASANDIVRNFTIAAWAIRRHLDYVSRFEFKSKCGIEAVDEQIEKLVRVQSRPRNFDRGGRFGREKGFRVAEARRVVDGDTGLLMLQSGMIQGIAADLVRNPEDKNIDKADGREWVDGVQIDPAGAARRFALWGREKGGITKKYRRTVAAENFIHYGFFDYWASEQIRGISPFVAALNPLRDVYENIDYALIRSKLAQLFALAITRDKDSGPLDDEFPPADADDDGQSDSDSDNCEANKPRKRELDLTGPNILDLDIGEGVDVIESKTPSTELQQFSRLVVMIALKALDIPYSFFDEAHTNYSGSRTSWLQYERACIDRRDDQIEMRRRWTVFQLRRWIYSRELELPRGVTLEDLDWEWIPKGMPWWKPSEELTADLKAIAAGLTSPQQVCAKNGLGDPFDNLRETAMFIKHARDVGNELIGEPFRVNFDPGPFPSAITDNKTSDDDNKPNE